MGAEAASSGVRSSSSIPEKGCNYSFFDDFTGTRDAV